ncbi:MAG: DUF123 domain-containing protein, partial [Candidatus Tectomicrobia bacterium]|nr:DUF123 domain-containing protein [Candidatus Tectomicrobia bacterium]
VRVMAWSAYPDNSQPECQLAQRLLAWGQIVIPRFGASDCSCPAHLLYYPRRLHAACALRHAELRMEHEESGKNSWRGINKIK